MHYYWIQLMNEYVEASPLFQNIAKLRLNDKSNNFFSMENVTMTKYGNYEWNGLWSMTQIKESVGARWLYITYPERLGGR